LGAKNQKGKVMSEVKVYTHQFLMKKWKSNGTGNRWSFGKKEEAKPTMAQKTSTAVRLVMATIHGDIVTMKRKE